MNNKISYRELNRKYKKLEGVVVEMRQRHQINFQALMLTAVKLYMLNPNEEIFTNGTFKDNIMELIKKEAERRVSEEVKKMAKKVKDAVEKVDDGEIKDVPKEASEEKPNKVAKLAEE